MTSQTVRLTVAQAVVSYLSRQYSLADGQRRRLIPATLGIFGHGNVAGLGQALDQLSDAMPLSRAATSRPWCTRPPRSPSTAGGMPPWP
jgi:Acetolactate synthase